MRCATVIAGFAAIATAAAPVQAQPPQSPRFYVGAGAVSDDDRTNSRLSDRPEPTWTLVVGYDFSPHAGIRLLIDGPRKVTRTSGWAISQQRGEQPDVWFRTMRTQRSMTYGGVVDWHGRIARRLTIAATFGLVTVTHDDDVVVFRERRHPDGTTTPLPDERHPGEFPWSGVSFGLETPILLMRRLEIVPEVRMIRFVLSDSPRPYILRPGVGMRWRF